MSAMLQATAAPAAAPSLPPSTLHVLAAPPAPVNPPRPAAEVEDAGSVWLGAGAVKPPPRPPGEIGVDDWDTLFRAVESRLRATVDDPREGQVHTRKSVLECVLALEQLHSALANERRRREQTERQLRDLHAALAQSRAELAGTQADDRRARHSALHDGLTSLPNRGHFRQRIDVALSPPAPARPALAVLYLDLDGFKVINDRHGHGTGDELLRIVAFRLARAVRAEDMVCRMGGDEFACLLVDELARDRLSQLACKLFDVISAPIQVGELRLTVRPSIGIAVCPTDGNDADALLRRADSAMSRAKRRQIGYAFVDRHSDG